jgi:hypothetical protein
MSLHTDLAIGRRLRVQDQDDPASSVARLGYLQGSDSFEPAGESDWVEAVPNRPVTTGDKLWVDKGSRAEAQLGYRPRSISAKIPAFRFSISMTTQSRFNSLPEH